VITKSSPL
jgi:large subunit ribosomal protein LP1